ncbi:hypothetical protein SDC9_127734 [bioreactor metagenome]|uniref:Uncharacterized protein n=1 Tax=bioreactor metagenome TaxID=1076179 RepID=A0A645CUW6_9ZZZZ
MLGFIAFHGAVEERSRFAAFLDQIRVGHMGHAGEIHHGRIVLCSTCDQQNIYPMFLHQAIQIRFHNDVLCEVLFTNFILY